MVTRTITSTKAFPSPLGASYFQILVNILKRRVTPFPSPLGASYFQIQRELQIVGVDELFPSPLGASYFQIKSTTVA